MIEKWFFSNDEKLIKQQTTMTKSSNVNENWNNRKIDEVIKSKTNVAKHNWHDRTIEIDRKIDVDDVNWMNIVN